MVEQLKQRPSLSKNQRDLKEGNRLLYEKLEREYKAPQLKYKRS